MINKKPASNFGFADSHYQSFSMSEEDNLIVYLKSWDEKKLRVVFVNTIQFLYRLPSVGKELYEIDEPNDFLEEALMQEYESVPAHHPFKLFQFEDIKRFPFIKVVAESVHVFKD